MKRLFSCVLAFSLMLALTLPVFADVIWEPRDSFYSRHRDECSYEDRRYELAGVDGTVNLWSAPNGLVTKTLQNGLVLRVQFRWTGDSLEWGYVYGSAEDGTSLEGWAPMDDMSLVYDSRQFTQDHKLEIKDGDPADVSFTAARLYSYPRGPLTGSVLNERRDYMPFSDIFSTVYTDDEGLRWGYVGYYMGRCDAWVCIDDPESQDLSTGIVPTEPSVSQLRGETAVAPGIRMQGTIIISAVVLVVLCTGAVIIIIRRKKPVKEKNS